MHYRVMSQRHGAEEGKDHGDAYSSFDAANRDAQRIFSNYSDLNEPLSDSGHYVDYEARVSVLVCECPDE